MRTLVIIAGVTAMLMFLGCVVACQAVVGSDEIQSKPEWSMLQNLEFQYRDRSIGSEPIFVRRNGYCAIGVPSKVGGNTVWLLADAKHEPLVKYLPEVDHEITASQFNAIEAECALSVAVREHLKRRVNG